MYMHDYSAAACAAGLAGIRPSFDNYHGIRPFYRSSIYAPFIDLAFTPLLSQDMAAPQGKQVEADDPPSIPQVQEEPQGPANGAPITGPVVQRPITGPVVSVLLRDQSSSVVDREARMRTAVDTSASLSTHQRLTSKRSVASVYWCSVPPISSAAAVITSVRSVSSAFRRKGNVVRFATRRTSP